MTLAMRPQLGVMWRRWRSCAAQREAVEINFQEYAADSMTNVSPRILAHVNRNLHLQRGHPLSLVRAAALQHFQRAFVNVKGAPLFSVYDRLNPVVSVHQNFDSLLVPLGHPSRNQPDCFYVNSQHLLRAHTTAHLHDLLRSGLNNFITVGDVYRRDAIDSTHYPVFHQLDAFRSQTKDQLFPDQPDLDIFERSYKPTPFKLPVYCPKVEDVTPNMSCVESTKQKCHTLEAVKVMEYQLKHALIGLVKHLFGENIDYRWVDAYFPFTQPSWELEIFFNNKWMEVLGCGIIRNEILHTAGATNIIAYAFGVGLERIAMALYDIPDIRLFWSNDTGFLNQFSSAEPGRILKYRPISVYPQCKRDMAFWLPEGLSKNDFFENNFYDLVREIGGDIIEQVKLFDTFTHPKTNKTSLCFNIVYRHMERTLSNEEAMEIHKKIEKAAVDLFNVTMR